jgi:hypothetical protein
MKFRARIFSAVFFNVPETYAFGGGVGGDGLVK